MFMHILAHINVIKNIAEYIEYKIVTVLSAILTLMDIDIYFYRSVNFSRIDNNASKRSLINQN